MTGPAGHIKSQAVLVLSPLSPFHAVQDSPIQGMVLSRTKKGLSTSVILMNTIPGTRNYNLLGDSSFLHWQC